MVERNSIPLPLFISSPLYLAAAAKKILDNKAQKEGYRRVSVEFKFLISRSLTMAFRQCHSVVERVEDQCPLLSGAEFDERSDGQ